MEIRKLSELRTVTELRAALTEMGYSAVPPYEPAAVLPDGSPAGFAVHAPTPCDGPERQAAANWRAACRISGEDDGLTLEQLEALWRTGPAACATLRKMARLRQQGAKRPHLGFGKVAR